MFQLFGLSPHKLVMPEEERRPQTAPGVSRRRLHEDPAVPAFSFQLRYQQAVQRYSACQTQGIHSMFSSNAFSQGQRYLFESLLKTVGHITAITVCRERRILPPGQFFNQLGPRNAFSSIDESLICAIRGLAESKVKLLGKWGRALN